MGWTWGSCSDNPDVPWIALKTVGDEVIVGKGPAVKRQ